MNVVQLFEEQVASNPQKIAIVDEGVDWPFDDLLKHSIAFSHSLCDQGIEPGKPVAVIMRSSALAVAAFMGIARIGAFYVPIDPSQPSSRMRAMLDSISCDCYVSIDPIDGLDDLSHISVGEAIPQLIEAFEPMQCNAQASDPLYAIFTSGSTGIPKCVVKSHGSILSFMDDFSHLFGLSSEDVLASQAAFDFDVSAKDIYSCLLFGARLNLVPKAAFMFPARLPEVLASTGASVLIWPAASIRFISRLGVLDSELMKKMPLRLIAFSGEALSAADLQKWIDAFPNAQIVNMYAPTEVTGNCLYWKVVPPLTKRIPIGLPFPRATVRLLNGEGREIASANTKGQIAVSGPYLSLGYFKDDAKTKERFIEKIDESGCSSVEYLTGDIAFYDEDGNLVFAGRADNQVKHGGHRIELEEVERAFDGFDSIARCVCMHEPEDDVLVLHYEKAPSSESVDAMALSAYVRKVLPSYMAPSNFIEHEKIPTTRNGKVDRQALKVTSQK